MILKEDLFEDQTSITEGPEVRNMGFVSMLISTINDTWNKILSLNDIISCVEQQLPTECSKFIPVLEDIVASENTNIGKLQAILQAVSPNIENINQGEQEAKEQFDED